jgi:hypothetical protein
MGVRENGASVEIAVIGELGCTPQSIAVQLVSYASGAFTSGGSTVLAPAGSGFQTTPTVAWSASRNLWLATWVASGPVVMGRFFDDSLTPKEAAFTVPGAAFAAQALGNAHAVVVSPSYEISDSKLRCP